MAVRAGFGPTLPEILGPARWRVLRAVLALAGVLVLGGAVFAVTQSSTDVVVVRAPVAFNFIADPPLRRVGPARVEQRSGPTFVASLSVAALALAPYRGEPGAVLPIVADRLQRRLAARWSDFQVVGEGRARINESPGYGLIWEARQGTRRIFGREYLLLPDEPGVRAGARIELLSTYAGGVSTAEDVGRVGPLKRSLRSFRFGTERP